MLLLRRPQHVAHATSLVAITVPATAAAARFAVDGAVVWWGAAIVAGTSLAGVQAGAALLHRIPERALRFAFAALLLVLTAWLLVGGDPAGPQGGEPVLTLAAGLGHGALGLVTGTVSALLGIGGGAVIVPVLAVLLGYGQHVAEGTSLAVIIPTALVGAVTHGRRGYTEWPVGWRLGAGGLVGALAGAQVALALPADILARAFGAFLAVVTVTMVRRATRPAGAPATAPEAAGDLPDLDIRPLTPETSGDLLRFFDGPAFPEGHEWAGCYCYYDRAPGGDEDFDPGDAARNRAAMARLLDAQLVRGWLAYDGGEPVAWCSVSSRVELPHLKVDAPAPPSRRRVAVVNCFVVAPAYRGRGVARRLLDAAVEAAAYQGFDVVEAYPYHGEASDRSYRGPLPMFLDAGFEVVAETPHLHVVRRELRRVEG